MKVDISCFKSDIDKGCLRAVDLIRFLKLEHGFESCKIPSETALKDLSLIGKSIKSCVIDEFRCDLIITFDKKGL